MKPSHHLFEIRKQRGLTVIEALIAVLLASLLFSLVFQLIVPVFRRTSERSVRVEIQQKAAITMTKLVNDLQSTSISGVSIGPEASPTEASALALHPLLDIDADGNRVYNPFFLVYAYDPTQNSLYRWKSDGTAVGASASDSKAVRLEPGQVRALGQMAVAQGRAVSSDVTEFEFTHSGNENVVQPFTARIRLEKDQGPEHLRRFELSRDIYLPND
jgi:hypothetical protein